MSCNCGNIYIVNKTKNLCQECNFKRLHDGLSSFEHSRIKSNEQKIKKNNNLLKTKKRFKKSSNAIENKTIKIEDQQKYKQTCEEIDSTRELLCTGCKKYQGGDIRLSHSHIISRADCNKINRKDLIHDKNNITLHCLDFGENTGCHRKWESKNINIMSKLLDFHQNMDYIRQINLELFNKITNR